MVRIWRMGSTEAWLFLSIFVLSTINSLSQPINESIPYSRSKNYEWTWSVQILVSGIGVVYNFICLSMMLSLNDSNKMSFYTINVTINAIDLAFSLQLLIFGSIDLAHKRFIGGGFACFLFSFLTFSLSIWSICSVVGMSWVAKSDLCNKNKTTQREMVIYTISTLIYSCIVVLVAMVIPYGGYGVIEDGAICEPSLGSKLGAPIIYLFGWYAPVAYLSYNLYQIYITIQRAQKILKDHDIKERAKERYIKMVMKMGYFILTFSVYSLNLGGSLYEWSRSIHVSGTYSALSGLAGIIVGCIINPTLFFYLNVDLREKFWQLIGIKIAVYLQYIGVLSCISALFNKKFKVKTRGIRIKPLRVQVTSLSSAKSSAASESALGQTKAVDLFEQQYRNKNSFLSTRSARVLNIFSLASPKVDTVDYRDPNTWLLDSDLFKAFTEHGRKEYTTENFLFFSDSRRYYFCGMSLLDELESLEFDDMECNEAGDAALGKIPQLWDELKALGNRMFTLYISVPSAPLEINIPADIRGNLIKTFENADSNYPPIKTFYNSRQSLNRAIGTFVHIFDESVEVIKEIIVSDIWPRFRYSNIFLEAKASHNHSAWHSKKI